jgi:hypothetical protein
MILLYFSILPFLSLPSIPFSLFRVLQSNIVAHLFVPIPRSSLSAMEMSSALLLADCAFIVCLLFGPVLQFPATSRRLGGGFRTIHWHHLEHSLVEYSTLSNCLNLDECTDVLQMYHRSTIFQSSQKTQIAVGSVDGSRAFK